MTYNITYYGHLSHYVFCYLCVCKVCTLFKLCFSFFCVLIASVISHDAVVNFIIFSYNPVRLPRYIWALSWVVSAIILFITINMGTPIISSLSFIDLWMLYIVCWVSDANKLTYLLTYWLTYLFVMTSALFTVCDVVS